MSGEAYPITQSGTPCTGPNPCLLKGNIFNTAKNANTNYFATALSPINPPCRFRIYICLQASNVFKVTRTVAGVTVSENLNGGTALSANCAYIFDILVCVNETINLQHTTANDTISECTVTELLNW